MKTVFSPSAKLSKVIEEGRERGKISQKAIGYQQVPQRSQTGKSGSTAHLKSLGLRPNRARGRPKSLSISLGLDPQLIIIEEQIVFE